MVEMKLKEQKPSREKVEVKSEPPMNLLMMQKVHSLREGSGPGHNKKNQQKLISILR